MLYYPVLKEIMENSKNEQEFKQALADRDCGAVP
jgi:hypothetical protein